MGGSINTSNGLIKSGASRKYYVGGGDIRLELQPSSRFINRASYVRKICASR